ncbi:MAG: hypothetical protein PHU63_03430 [Candidatus ainarchaeum sp.]|nr:hypothetical protein [Candidatus ainarchaeum sp.]
MCILCEKTKEISEYKTLISKSIIRDQEILRNTEILSQEKMPILQELCYSSVKWPVKLYYPMFEARNAFAVPNNYFQSLFINGGKMGVYFSHGSTRSVFFSGERLILLSKTINHHEGMDYFTSFTLAHFNKNEYVYGYEDGIFYIRAKIKKTFFNLINKKIENKEISFNFLHYSLKNRILSKDQALTSTHMKNIYDNYSSITAKLSSSDLAGYVISVPHFSPHPYLLQVHEQLGYGSNRELQEFGVNRYFESHLSGLNLSRNE